MVKGAARGLTEREEREITQCMCWRGRVWRVGRNGMGWEVRQLLLEGGGEAWTGAYGHCCIDWAKQTGTAEWHIQ